MTAQTALQQALAAWGRRETADRQESVDAAVALAEWKVFSMAHIIQITGLPRDFTHELIGKSDKTGGAFNAEMLPFLYDLWLLYIQSPPRAATQRTSPDVVNKALFVMKQGCSAGMVEKLVGIPARTLTRWAAAS